MEQQKVTPKFFFITLGLLIALITSVVSLINLLFGVLDSTFPDVLSSSYVVGYSPYAHSALRGALATLIIFFPIYFILERYWSKLSKQNLSKWDSVLRKWSIYLILFLSSITILIDLVVLVRYFVGGEITIRFILKVVATLVVAGLAYLYYLKSLLGNFGKVINKKIFGAFSIIIVIGSIVWSFLIVGGPTNQRAFKLDQRRVDDLQSINNSIVYFWQQTQTLPSNLGDLSVIYSGSRIPNDPEFESGRKYEYSIISENNLTYKLCATFTEKTPQGWVPNNYDNSIFMREDFASTEPSFISSNTNWAHEKGYTCFEQVINPIFTPPFKKD